ncbi:hypothetical protein NDU88_006487 [Pleurodeles waltl]|uniref:Uncharacterized protein n=1 Tax=Pleurodeles waltl TaxID=8319 RepID=A0AAV7RN74_PLEWA|nr:hypothetical protein NDU88_006487 [Pleurodeles waltl]
MSSIKGIGPALPRSGEDGPVLAPAHAWAHVFLWPPGSLEIQCRKGKSVPPATLSTARPAGRVFLWPPGDSVPEGEIRSSGNTVRSASHGWERLFMAAWRFSAKGEIRSPGNTVHQKRCKEQTVLFRSVV